MTDEKNNNQKTSNTPEQNKAWRKKIRQSTPKVKPITLSPTNLEKPINEHNNPPKLELPK